MGTLHGPDEDHPTGICPDMAHVSDHASCLPSLADDMRLMMLRLAVDDDDTDDA